MRRPAVVRLACALAFAGAIALAACSGGSGGDAAADKPSDQPVPTNPGPTQSVPPATGLACTLLNQSEVEQTLHMSITAVQGTEAAATCSWEPQASLPALDVALNDDPGIVAAQYLQEHTPSTDVGDDDPSSPPSDTVTDTQLGDKAFFLDKPSVVELYVMKGGRLMMLRLHKNDYPALSTGADETLTALADLALTRY